VTRSVLGQLQRKRLCFALGLGLLLALFLALGALAQEPFTVDRIEVVGNQHVSTQEILAAVPFRAGDTVDAAAVRAAAQAIEDLGYFVRVDPQLNVEEGQVVATFTVVEYPLIEEITLLGVPEFQPQGEGLIPYLLSWLSAPPVTQNRVLTILKEHDIVPGKVLNVVKLEQALKEVLQEYQERDLATVQVGQVLPGAELVIEIRELPVLGHRLEGLVTVPEEVARELITVPTGEVGRLSQIQASHRRLSSSVYFSQVELDYELEPDGVRFIWKLTERVLLSQPQPVARVELVGCQAISPERVLPLVGELPPGPVDNFQVLRALAPVNDYYRREGFFMLDFKPLGLEQGVLRVQVLEGRLAEIVVQGNTVTQARVIRRVLGLQPGEVLTQAKFLAARQALMALGYFSDVVLTPAWGEAGVVLTVEVTELEKLGRIGGSVGLSPEGGLVGNLEYAQKNILGTAQDLSLTYSHGLGDQLGATWNLGYTGHAFPVYDRVQVNLYRREKPQQEGTKVTWGGEGGLSYPLAHYLDLEIGLTHEQSQLLPVGEWLPPRTALKLGITFNSRDDPFFPRSGRAWKLVAEKAGTFAPGVEYLSLTGEVANFTPLDLFTPWGHLRAAFAQRLLFNWGWGLAEDYLFELGGATTVRGAETISTPRMALLNSELRLELTQGAYLAAFWDLGVDLAGGELKSSLGLEIAVYLGGMFVRLDMAWPSDRPWTWVPAFEFEMSPMF